jgi:hypothetical protein
MSVLNDTGRSVPPPNLQQRIDWTPVGLRSAVTLLRHVERRTLLLHHMPLLRSDAATAFYTPIDLFFNHPRNQGRDVISKAAGLRREKAPIAFHEYHINLFFQAHYRFLQQRIVLSATQRTERQESAVRGSQMLSGSGDGEEAKARCGGGILLQSAPGISVIQRSAHRGSLVRASRALPVSGVGGEEQAQSVSGIQRIFTSSRQSEQAGRHASYLVKQNATFASLSGQMLKRGNDRAVPAQLHLQPHRLASHGFMSVIRHDDLAKIHATRIEMNLRRHQVVYVQSRPVQRSLGGSFEVGAKPVVRKERAASVTAEPYSVVDQLFRMGLERAPVKGMTLQEVSVPEPSSNRSGEMKSAGIVEMLSSAPEPRSRQEIELIADKVSRIIQQRNRFEKERRGEF